MSNYDSPSDVDLQQDLMECLESLVGKAVTNMLQTEVWVILINKLPQSFYDNDPALDGTIGQAYVAIVDNPRRFKRSIPFKPPQGAIRISRAPASFLRRTVVA
jgi:hypothetical protein